MTDVDYRAVFGAIPTPYLIMTPDLVIVGANTAYLANVGRTLEELVGVPAFGAFPPSQDALDENGVPRVQVSLERARDTGLVDVMPMQQYDIHDAAAGGLTRRFWSLISVPIMTADGTCALVVQRAEDITDVVLDREHGGATAERGARGELVETDLYARAQELSEAVAAKEIAGQRLAGLAEVALALAAADSVQRLVDVVFGAGQTLLGAAGGAIAVRTEGSDVLDVTLTSGLGEQAQQEYAHLPLTSSMPAAIAARGEMVIVRDRDAAEAYDGLPHALSLTDLAATVSVPLGAAGRLIGSLSMAWAAPRVFPEDEVDLLRAFAAQCAQVLDRLQVLELERAAALAVQRVSETLQRSLLTPPPTGLGRTIAVGYLPASQVAQVGGDWYDAFETADGTLSLVIGDVAGHDEDAAAAMAQARNVLRGVAQTLQEPPAAVLAGFDRALSGLKLSLLATVVVAQLQREGATRTLTWCNAGHPPPVLIRADGTVRLLEAEPDLLVGLTTEIGRIDHEVHLESGDTVLLYTDGLVETRGGDIEQDLAGLVSLVARLGAADGPQALVDGLVSDLSELSDDVALLVVRVD